MLHIIAESKVTRRHGTRWVIAIGRGGFQRTSLWDTFPQRSLVFDLKLAVQALAHIAEDLSSSHKITEIHALKL